MPEDIAPLIELQKIDLAIIELEKSAQAKEETILQKKAEIETHKQNFSGAKKSLHEAQHKKKELEAQIAEKEKLIEGRQVELNKVKTNDAYKALSQEIDRTKEEISKLEDVELQVMENIDQLEKEFGEKQKTAGQEEAGLQAALKEREGEKGALLDQAQEEKKKRAEFAKTVPSALLQTYEQIHSRREGLAIVPLNDNACGGCRMTMSPGRVNLVRSGKSLQTCESCNRILYYVKEEATQEANAPQNPA